MSELVLDLPQPPLELEQALRLAQDVAERVVRAPLTASVSEQPDDLIQLQIERTLDDGTLWFSNINIERCYTERDFQRGVAACFDHLQRMDAQVQAERTPPAPPAEAP